MPHSRETAERCPAPARRTAPLAWGCGVGFCVLLTFVGSAVWAAYAAWQEELNLHHTLYALQLVNEYVDRQGHWPRSWDELEAMPYDSQTPRSVRRGNVEIFIDGAMEFDWPRQAAEFKRRVDIDFDATPEQVLSAPVLRFQPVRPHGSGFEYWKYGFVEQLQTTVRSRTPGLD